MNRKELNQKLIELESLESLYHKSLTPPQLKQVIEARKKHYYKDIICASNDTKILALYKQLQSVSSFIVNALN